MFPTFVVQISFLLVVVHLLLFLLVLSETVRVLDSNKDKKADTLLHLVV